MFQSGCCCRMFDWFMHPRLKCYLITTEFRYKIMYVARIIAVASTIECVRIQDHAQRLKYLSEVQFGLET